VCFAARNVVEFVIRWVFRHSCAEIYASDIWRSCILSICFIVVPRNRVLLVRAFVICLVSFTDLILIGHR